jgi:hypothetical protein
MLSSPPTWKEIRALTRLRRLPVVRVSATAPSVQFDPRKTRAMPGNPEGKAERNRGGLPLKRIAELQGGRCFLCDKHMWTPTREHVKPRVAGGTNYRNVLAAHSRCNNMKADRMPYVCELLYCAILYDMVDTPKRVRYECVA